MGRLKIFHWIQQFRRYRNPLRGVSRFPQSKGSRKQTGIPVWERADSTHSLPTPSQAIPPPNANPITHTPPAPQVPGLRRPGGCLTPSAFGAPLPPRQLASKPSDTRTNDLASKTLPGLTGKIQALHCVFPKLCPYLTRFCVICCAPGSKQKASQTKKSRNAESRGRRRPHRQTSDRGDKNYDSHEAVGPPGPDSQRPLRGSRESRW